MSTPAWEGGSGDQASIQVPVFSHTTDWGWTLGRYEQMQRLWVTLPAVAVRYGCKRVEI